MDVGTGTAIRPTALSRAVHDIQVRGPMSIAHFGLSGYTGESARLSPGRSFSGPRPAETQARPKLLPKDPRILPKFRRSDCRQTMPKYPFLPCSHGIRLNKPTESHIMMRSYHVCVRGSCRQAGSSASDTVCGRREVAARANPLPAAGRPGEASRVNRKFVAGTGPEPVCDRNSWRRNARVSTRSSVC